MSINKKKIYLTNLFIILYTQFSSHTYNYIEYSNWVNHISEKKVYLINDNSYCVLGKLGLFFNEYICTQNIAIQQNYLNTTEYNINQIIPVETNKTNLYGWIILVHP